MERVKTMFPCKDLYLTDGKGNSLKVSHNLIKSLQDLHEFLATFSVKTTEEDLWKLTCIIINRNSEVNWLRNNNLSTHSMYRVVRRFAKSLVTVDKELHPVLSFHVEAPVVAPA